MILSVEISMYPLNEGYKDIILDFLEYINDQNNHIEIKSSNMSTRLFGEFAAVTGLLNDAMHYSMEKYGKIVFVCKYLQGDARELKNFD